MPQSMDEGCPDLELLAAYVDRKLAPYETRTVEGHLADCAVCRQLIRLALEGVRTLPVPGDGGPIVPRV